MMSETEVRELIDEWLSHCIDFIESDRKSIKRRIAGSDKILLESKLRTNCPICSIKMVEPKKGASKKGTSPHRPNDISIEHIVPLCLGGDNQSKNLTAICHSCNDTRNAMMGKLLPDMTPTSKTPIRGQKLDLSIQTIVENFIEWAIRTIYAPESKLNSSLCRLFDDLKGEDVYASGIGTLSASTTSAVESTELLDVMKQILETQKAILEQLQKSPFKRFKDWLFSLLPRRKKVRKTKPAIEAEIAEAKPAEEDNQQHHIETDVEGTITSVTENQFDASDMRREILQALTGPMPMPQFNAALTKSLHDRGHLGYTAKSFVQACGVPKSWSMHKVLSTYLPASVGIEGDASSGIVKPLSSRFNQESKDQSYSESEDRTPAYPVIRGFNSTTKTGKPTLRLPQHPLDLLKIIEFIESHRGEEITWNQIKEKCLHSFHYLSKLRLKSTFTRIVNATKPSTTGSGAGSGILWPEYPGPLQLVNQLEQICVEMMHAPRFEYLRRDYDFKETLAKINGYFDTIRGHEEPK